MWITDQRYTSNSVCNNVIAHVEKHVYRGHPLAQQGMIRSLQCISMREHTLCVYLYHHISVLGEEKLLVLVTGCRGNLTLKFSKNKPQVHWLISIYWIAKWVAFQHHLSSSSYAIYSFSFFNQLTQYRIWLLVWNRCISCMISYCFASHSSLYIQAPLSLDSSVPSQP